MSHQVRLDDDVYERIKSQKQEDETFSETIDRLTSEWTLLDFAESDPAIDSDKHRELLAESERQGKKDTRERLERMGIDAGE